MKLYYKTGACSLASHIALREAGADFTLEKVDTKAGKTESGEDYSKINPNGYVPALRFDDGEILTEGPAILYHLAETNPDAHLAPKAGTRERARVQSYLSFTGSELHHAFGPLFGDKVTDETRKSAEATIAKRMKYMESELSDGREFLAGERFSIADAYFFVVAGWTRHVGIDIDQWPHVAEYARKIAARPSVKAAMQAEGLTK